MSQHYYADGAIHQDNHKEITIGGNVTTEALSQIMKSFFAGDAEDAEIVEEKELECTTPVTYGEQSLCIALNGKQRKVLDAAAKAGIIEYNPQRQGYDVAEASSQALVAYLCGRLFCADYTNEGVWIKGARFEVASYCQQLFGFDVAGTRRSVQGNAGGKSPKGYERVDKLFK